jgi:hypothetical protein
MDSLMRWSALVVLVFMLVWVVDIGGNVRTLVEIARVAR